MNALLKMLSQELRQPLEVGFPLGEGFGKEFAELRQPFFVGAPPRAGAATGVLSAVVSAAVRLDATTAPRQAR
ncbi:MAG TPA: hypothetical protein PKM43_22225 [Verrucomicrobiota bacterium]|nr:hypothetical protein [Verrucomicrobiota bacterium]